MAKKRIVPLVLTLDGSQVPVELGRRLKEAESQITSFNRRVKSSASAVTGFTSSDLKAFQSISREQIQLAKQVSDNQIREQQRALNDHQRIEASKVQLAGRTGRAQMQEAQRAAQSQQRSIKEASQSFTRSEREKVQATQRGTREQIRAVEDGATKQISIFGRIARSYDSTVNRRRDALGRFTSSGGGGGDSVLPGLGQISEIIQAIPQIGNLARSLTRPLTDAAEEGIQFNAFLENTRIGLETLLKSAPDAKQAASDLLATLQAFSERTPFEFGDVVKNTQSLMGMKFAADEVIPSLTGIGDAIAATGDFSEERLRGVIVALGQMRLKGKVSAEEMMQLSERQIDAWGLLSKAIGKTTEETMQLAQQGKLRGKEATQAIIAMMEQEYQGAMERQSKTYTGLLSNLKDIRDRSQGVATQGLFGDLKGVMESAVAKGDLANTLATGINNAISPVSGLIRGTVQTVLGGGITGGLTDAFKAAESLLPSYAWSLFDTGILRPFKAAAGIHSPSTVFIGLGLNMAEGLMLGLQEGLKGADLRSYLEKLLSDPRVRAFLDTIAKAEGADYITKVGGGKVNDLSLITKDRRAIEYKKGAKPSTAAGRYQFLNDTWDEVSKALGLTDFSPRSQDLAALWLAEFKKNKDGSQRKAISTLLSGDTAGAITASRKEWASFPGAGYGQGERSMNWMLKTFQQSLGSASGGFQGGPVPVRIVNFEQLMNERDAATSRFKREAAEAAARAGLKIPGLNSDIEGGATEQAREWQQAQANLPAFKFTDVQEWNPEKAKKILDAYRNSRALIADTAVTTNMLAQTITPRAIVATNELGEAALKSAQAVKAQTLGAGEWYQAVINEGGKAAEEAKKQAEETAKALADIGGQFFQNLLEKPREAMQSLWQDLKSFLLGAARETVQSKLFSMLNSGGASGGGGSGFNLTGIFNLLRGGGSAAGGFGGGLTPSGGILNLASNSGGARNIVGGFRQGGFVSGLKSLLGFGGGAATEATSGASALTATGAGGALTAADISTFLGGGGAAGGGGGLASLGAFMLNPFTIAAVGAGVTGFFLWKHFKSNTEKKLREAIKSTYGIDIKDQSVLKQIKEIGEQTFGRGNVGKHISEVIALGPVKEIIAAHAESTGQDASKVDSTRGLSEESDPRNRHIVRSGAPASSPTASPSFNRAAKAPAPQVSVPSSGPTSSSEGSRSSNNGGMPALMVSVLIATLNRVAAAVEGIEPVEEGALLGRMVKKSPNTITDGFLESQKSSYRTDEVKRTAQGVI